MQFANDGSFHEIIESLSERMIGAFARARPLFIVVDGQLVQVPNSVVAKIHLVRILVRTIHVRNNHVVPLEMNLIDVTFVTIEAGIGGRSVRCSGAGVAQSGSATDAFWIRAFESCEGIGEANNFEADIGGEVSTGARFGSCNCVLHQTVSTVIEKRQFIILVLDWRLAFDFDSVGGLLLAFERSG